MAGELPSKSKTIWEGGLGINESGLWRIFEHKIILFLGWLGRQARVKSEVGRWVG